MRKRFILYLSLFGLALSLLFGLLCFALYYQIEDRAYERQLIRMIAEDSDGSLMLSSFSGPITDLPPGLQNRVAALSPGKHEIESDHGNEIHLFVQGDRVSLIQIPESATETILQRSILFAILFTTLTGFVLGKFLTRKIVTPVESLCEWLQFPSENLSSPPKSDVREIQLLSNALHSFLEQRNSMVARESAFVREASHELLTPISIIRGVCEIAEESPITPEALARIRRSANRMEHTSETLLCLAREELRLQKASFEKEKTDLLEELQEAYGPSPSLESHFSWSPEDPLVSRMILLALGTLLRNAYEHAQASQITISLTPSNLTLSDNGIGITQIEAICKSLSSLHPLPNGGLGLSLVERICRRMDWSFHLENTDEGHQSRIQF